MAQNKVVETQSGHCGGSVSELWCLGQEVVMAQLGSCGDSDRELWWLSRSCGVSVW
jgi:hypothetical protein